MATQVKHRRGTNAEILAGTPAIAELWFNTTDNSIHMGDGATPGGIKHVNANTISSTKVLSEGSTTPRTLAERFAESINVKDFGATGDGVTDDTVAIQAAADAMQSGMSLDFFDGVFVITSVVTLQALSNTTYNFGNAKIVYTSIDGTAFELRNTSTSKTLDADVSIGDGSILLTDASGISKGQLLKIGNEQSWFIQTVGTARNNLKGELLVVDSVVNTDEVALWGEGCLFGYPSASNNPYVEVYDLVENVTFKGGYFVGPGAVEQTNYVLVEGVRNLQFLNMGVSDVNVGLGFSECAEVLVDGCNFKEIDLAGLGYAVNIGTFNIDVVVSNCTGNRGRHFVTTTGENGITKGVLIIGNIFSGSINRAIDTHTQGWNTQIIGNVISGSFGGIQVRSPHSVVSGNKIIDCTEPENKAITGSRSSVSGILTTEMGHINLVIENNTVTNTARFGNNHGLRGAKFGIFGDAIDVRASANEVGYHEFVNEFVVIKGNTLQGFTNGANVAFKGANSNDAQGNHPKRLYVEGNLCDKSGYGNITVSGSSDHVRSMEVFIRNNVINTSTRSITHVGVVDARFVIMEGNSFTEGAQPELAIDNATWVSVTDNKLQTATNTEDYGFEPVLTNVDGAVVEQWSTGFNSRVVNLIGDAAYTLTISAINGSYVNQWVVSSDSVNQLSNTSSSTVTAVAGVITITQTSTFLWHLRPASPFVIDN